MIIKNNPFKINIQQRTEALLRYLKAYDLMFTDTLKTLDKIKTLLNKMEKYHLSKKSINEKIKFINKLASQIDIQVETHCFAGKVLLGGAYNHIMPRASIWIRTGINMDQRERIYFSTMTAQALGLLDNNFKLHYNVVNFKNQLEYMRDRIAKCSGDVKAYKKRMENVIDYTVNSGPFQFSNILIQKDIKALQIQMLTRTEKALWQNYKICSRLKHLSVKIKNKTLKECQSVQVEVSALVDEIDRIASQTSFNNMLLLTGNFAKDNSRASLWFLSDSSPNGLKRIYINTITTNSLSLKNISGMLELSLSTPGAVPHAVKLLDNALQKITSERKHIKNYIESLRQSTEFDESIKIKGII